MSPRKEVRLRPGPPVDLEADDVRDSRGRRIDAAYVERLVEAAEHARRGRPSLDRSPGPSPQIAVRLPEELYARARAVASERGMSLAALAREAVDDYLRRTG